MVSDSRRAWAALLCVWLLALSVSAAEAQATGESLPVVTVGFVFDGLPPEDAGETFERLQDLGETVRRETLSLTRRTFDVRFPGEKRLSGNWTVAGIRDAIDRLMDDPEVDIVVGLGIFSTTDLCRRQHLKKPTIAALAVDVDAQRLPVSSNRQGQMTSGRENLNYVLNRGSILRDIARFRQVVSFERVHVLADALVGDAIPEIPQAAISGGRELGVEMVLVSVVDSAADVWSRLPADAEAVYVTPLDRMPADEFEKLVSGLIERGLPSFSLRGRAEVEAGIMAGVRPRADVTRLSRRVALNLQRILQGEDAGTLPVELELQGGLVINMRTAKEIGYSPRFSVVREAELLHPEAVENLADRTLTLSDAVREAVRRNIALESGRRGVSAGAEEIDLARARRRPQAGFSATTLQIDGDRAAASFGSQPERTTTASLSVSQIIYSEALQAGVDIARQLQDSLEYEYEVERLDVALDAARAFLDVLRSKVLERVAIENRRLTESNLELARKREQIGFSGPADVYRWESELATARNEVNKAHSAVHNAHFALNRLLHGALEPMPDLTSPALDDPELITGFGRLNSYVDNAMSFALFRDFSVAEGLSNSPELKALDAGIAAQERSLLSTRRSYWAPDVALVGELERRISKAGEGSGGAAIPGFDPADADSWSVALEARLPLFQGGARGAGVRQANLQLAALRAAREAARESIELRIRVSLFDLSATFLAIELSRQANDAAVRNLELVTDAYSRGAISIIDLLDAQNAALVADQFSSNAIFDFLVDLMELQRATNNFDFFTDQDAREDWFVRLDAFFVENGREPQE